VGAVYMSKGSNVVCHMRDLQKFLYACDSLSLFKGNRCSIWINSQDISSLFVKKLFSIAYTGFASDWRLPVLWQALGQQKSTR
jgi:hypothetical protein